MCIFGGGGSTPAPEVMSTFAPPEPRTIQAANPLPRRKDVADVGEIKEIAIGGEQTRSTPAAGKKRGSKALQIALNQPSAGATTGGISNV